MLVRTPPLPRRLDRQPLPRRLDRTANAVVAVVVAAAAMRVRGHRRRGHRRWGRQKVSRTLLPLVMPAAPPWWERMPPASQRTRVASALPAQTDQTAQTVQAAPRGASRQRGMANRPVGMNAGAAIPVIWR